MLFRNTGAHAEFDPWNWAAELECVPSTRVRLFAGTHRPDPGVLLNSLYAASCAFSQMFFKETILFTFTIALLSRGRDAFKTTASFLWGC